MWTFSLYLEAVAILPQLVLLQRTRNIDNLTGQYVFLLGYIVVLNLVIDEIVFFFFFNNFVINEVLFFFGAFNMISLGIF